ncbi:hypothetical protein RchiOBHm_Chr5g0077401 [Rosa chinensis]|uniref:Uncharacterized protein n=1 Tax=Rosa chinensis TaxID=74649 RepID=A0A2P6QLY2_ROSCH|nr:hypothetical protein RchiOBHm_Chr5g0077401 [Rosa chinensis]
MKTTWISGEKQRSWESGTENSFCRGRLGLRVFTERERGKNRFMSLFFFFLSDVWFGHLVACLPQQIIKKLL